MQQQKPFLAVILFLMTGLAACDSTEIGDSKDVNQDKIYMDYNIAYTEAEDNVSVNFKYRFAGSSGTTLVLNDPSRVELDGEKLAVDSSEYAGAFYEANKKFGGFVGKHTISFTDFNRKKLDNSFDFAPFKLDALPEAADRNKDLVISYSTAAPGLHDYVIINTEGTDSSFSYQQPGPNSSLTIPAKELLRQKGKTLVLSCSFYRQISLSEITSEGGSFIIAYKLKPVKINLQP